MKSILKHGKKTAFLFLCFAGLLLSNNATAAEIQISGTVHSLGRDVIVLKDVQGPVTPWGRYVWVHCNNHTYLQAAARRVGRRITVKGDDVYASWATIYPASAVFLTSRIEVRGKVVHKRRMRDGSYWVYLNNYFGLPRSRTSRYAIVRVTRQQYADLDPDAFRIGAWVRVYGSVVYRRNYVWRVNYMEVDQYPFHNEKKAADVNGDGYLSPADYLVMVNAMNRSGMMSNLPRQSSRAGFIDVNGDNSFTPADIMSFINLYNRR